MVDSLFVDLKTIFWKCLMAQEHGMPYSFRLVAATSNKRVHGSSQILIIGIFHHLRMNAIVWEKRL